MYAPNSEEMRVLVVGAWRYVEMLELPSVSNDPRLVTVSSDMRYLMFGDEQGSLDLVRLLEIASWPSPHSNLPYTYTFYRESFCRLLVSEAKRRPLVALTLRNAFSLQNRACGERTVTPLLQPQRVRQVPRSSL